MSKYCQKCGTMMDDNAAFCQKCGAVYGNNPAQPQAQQPVYAQPQVQQPAYTAQPQVQQPAYTAQPQVQQPAYAAQPQVQQPAYAAQPQVQQPAYTAQPQVQQPAYAAQPQVQQPADTAYGAPEQAIQPAPPKKSKKGLFIGLGGGVVGIAVIVFLVFLLLTSGQRSPRGALKMQFDAMKKLDVDKAADVTFQANFSKDKDARDEFIEYYESIRDDDSDYAKRMKENYKHASYYNVTVRKLTSEEFDDFIDSISDSYETDDIKEVRQLYYNVVFGGNAYATSDYAIKVGSKWYIY